MTRSVQTHSEPVLTGEGASTGSTQMGDVQTGRVQTGGTIGAFDLLHVGHLRFLQQARQSCDWLKVAVGEDRLLVIGANRDVPVRCHSRDGSGVHVDRARTGVDDLQ